MKTTSTKPGDIYNYLKAIGPAFRKNQTLYWNFQCLLCNNTKAIILQEVRGGRSKSCGCQTNKGSRNGQWKGYKDLSGRTVGHYKKHALKRNIPFEVSDNYLWSIYISQEMKCPYTGKDLILIPRNGDTRTPSNASLDRIDSKKGYVEGNVQWVYKPINKFKSDLSETEFLNLCLEIADYIKGITTL